MRTDAMTPSALHVSSAGDSVVVHMAPDFHLNTTYDNVHNMTPTTTAMGNNASSNSGGMSALDDQTVALTRFVVYGLLDNVLVLLGWLGNTLSIVVLCNRRMRSSTSFYLTSLAVYDNFILLSMLLFFNLPALAYRLPAVGEAYSAYLPILPVGYPLSLAAQMGSIYTCVAFTVERFIAVCRPLHAANTCTKSRAKRAILLIFLWALIYNVPRCFHYDTDKVWNNATGQHETQVVVTEFGRSPVFQHVYIIYLQLIFMFLLPFLLILLLNTALLTAINRSRQQRQTMSTTATREHNLTVMLVAVIVVFLVCQFPTIVDNILVAVVGEERHSTVLHYQLLYTACTCLVTLNASLNFVLYCLFGKKFRLVLRHVLGLGARAHGPAPGKPSQYHSTLYQSSRTVKNGCGTGDGGGSGGTPLNHTYDVEVSLV